MSQIVFSVTDFVAVFNQTISYAYPSVTIEGELANFRVSKNRWVYFDLKDEQSSVKFFGSIYSLGSPLEEGMKLRVTGTPQLHSKFGFSITVRSISLAGEGTIKKAAKLLEAKLEKEGLFDITKKRQLPYPPTMIGFITSDESAAHNDFIKVLNARWGNVDIEHYNVQVQGEEAPSQLIRAINYFNAFAEVEVLVITRGGGSADDLQSFSNEGVVRAVAGSRIPTLVAIGHERDVSLAERASDMHASTPSNAAELLVPDRQHEKKTLSEIKKQLARDLLQALQRTQDELSNYQSDLSFMIEQALERQRTYLSMQRNLLDLTNPKNILAKGYAVARQNGRIIRSAKHVNPDAKLSVEFHDGQVETRVAKKRIIRSQGKQYG